eukprot:m.9016 g.9016  ORF g.9016 m.9016 type:complete len:214 (+) comp6809_c0_seq1:45-686(+)
MTSLWRHLHAISLPMSAFLFFLVQCQQWLGVSCLSTFFVVCQFLLLSAFLPLVCSIIGKITLSFNKTLLTEGGTMDKIIVQPYNVASGASKMFVLTNGSDFCMQSNGRGGGCRDDGTGRQFPVLQNSWVAVDIAEGTNPNEIVVDLSKTNGTAYAIAYAWTGDCCSENPPTSGSCPLASCPLMGSVSNLPPNPFVAHIVNNKCKCVAPQVCDE